MAVPAGIDREMIALKIAKSLAESGARYVNLGIGLPTLVSNFIPTVADLILESENGMLNYGPLAGAGEEDLDLRNAGGNLVTILPGASFFSSVDSFAMIRGGHLDAAVLGGYQVSERGDLANWMRPGRGIGSIGGAMDLVIGAKEVIVAMEHTTREGEPKIVRECSYPLTGKRCVNRIVTNLAIIDVTPDGLVLREFAPGLDPVDVQAATEAALRIAEDIKEMDF